ncbi:unnamed protein product [Urochloa humidicola]
MAAAAAAQQRATSGLTTLSHRLAKQFSAANGEGNLVFSPLSIHSALSLVAAGAQGRTLSELLSFLGAGSREGLEADARAVVGRVFPEAPQEGGPRVSYACGVWHDATRALKPAYRDVTAASFRSAVRAVDFINKPKEAGNEINRWVAKETNNLIGKILEPESITDLTRLVVANGVYFKGSWEEPLDKSKTDKDRFHCLDGSVVDARFMSSRDDQLIGVHDGFKVLRMPYAMPPPDPHQLLRGMEADGRAAAALQRRAVPPPSRYSMCVLLPAARDGLWSLVDKVASSPGFLQDHMPKKHVEVGEFRVPKFKLSFFTSVKEALQTLGVGAVFSGVEAELTDMLEDDGSPGRLYLEDVLHKAVIEVNEEGTEAAAVTVGLGAFSACFPRRQPPPVDFVADHPFAFFVVEEVSGAILFAGHVLDPSESAV